MWSEVLPRLAQLCPGCTTSKDLEDSFTRLLGYSPILLTRPSESRAPIAQAARSCDPEPRRTRTRDTLIRRPDKAILPDSGYSVKSCIIKASHD